MAWYMLVGMALAYVVLAAFVSFLSAKYYLHHHVTHRIITLGPVAKWFLRTWLWVTTGTVVSSWAAVHRKAHVMGARMQSPPDGRLGHKVSKAAEYYRASKTDELARFAKHLPEGWGERWVFRHPLPGLALLGILDVALFGVGTGLVVWLVQLTANPIMAAAAVGPEIGS